LPQVQATKLSKPSLKPKRLKSRNNAESWKKKSLSDKRKRSNTSRRYSYFSMRKQTSNKRS